MVNVLNAEDELETSNSGESGIESEAIDSIEKFDSDMPNQLRVKRRKGQQKGRQHHDSKGTKKGHTS